MDILDVFCADFKDRPSADDSGRLAAGASSADSYAGRVVKTDSVLIEIKARLNAMKETEQKEVGGKHVAHTVA